MGEVKEDIQKKVTFICIRSMTHKLYSMEVPKVGLSSNDDKRYLIDHKSTWAHGHFRIEELKTKAIL